MDELIQHLLDQPIANIIVLAGVAFFFIAAVGKVAGKIEPVARGRIVCGVLGLIMVPGGLIVHGLQDSRGAQTQPSTASADVVQTSEVTKTEPARANKGACKSGFVWRLAVPEDHVCVLPKARAEVASDNRLAPARTANGGQYGADTCRQGFVWREAVAGDHICVTPETRQLITEQNRLAPNRINP